MKAAGLILRLRCSAINNLKTFLIIKGVHNDPYE